MKDCTTLLAAYTEKYEAKHWLRVYDDTWGPLWVAGEEYGPLMIIRAKTFEQAYEIYVDESAPIDEAELHEAYGFDTDDEYRRAIEDAQDGVAEWPELAEGYYHQSNSTGTGIVHVGDYLWINPYSKHEHPQIHLVIRHARQRRRLIGYAQLCASLGSQPTVVLEAGGKVSVVGADNWSSGAGVTHYLAALDEDIDPRPVVLAVVVCR